MMAMVRIAGVALVLAALAGCASAPPTATVAPDDAARLVIVAVQDGPQARPAAGATGRASYRLSSGYAGSDAAQALTRAVATTHRLTELSAWTIDPLRLRCVLYRLPPGVDRDAALKKLSADERVALAQPLNHFETYGAAPAAGYNDPYLSLQSGFARLGAAAAQRISRGEGVRVAVIDTAVDVSHPDLSSRIASERDFAGGAPVSAAERHGTEVAGVIAATANNGIGIVGIAPGVRVLAYRTCWAVNTGGARCDSFSLAQALSQSITDQADVINLSLGGPADPLLQRLVEAAQQRGALVVGALPPSGRMEGFPSGAAGVIVAAVAEEGHAPARALPAPGRDVLTLQRAGGYGLASGSSLAAAHVSGALAVLRALRPQLDADTARALLMPLARDAQASITLCPALRKLDPAYRCDEP
jgi:subtilisin family serine protease